MYIALFFIAANIQIKPKYLDYMVYALVPIVLVNSLLGLLAFYGINILDNPTIQAMAISPEYAQYITEGSLLSTTINNPNYVSGIAAVIFVIFLTRFLFSDRVGEMVMYFLLLLLLCHACSPPLRPAASDLIGGGSFALVPAPERRIVKVMLKSAGLLRTCPDICEVKLPNQAVYASTMGFIPYMEVIPLVMLAVVLLMVIGMRYKTTREGNGSYGSTVVDCRCPLQ